MATSASGFPDNAFDDGGSVKSVRTEETDCFQLQPLPVTYIHLTEPPPRYSPRLDKDYQGRTPRPSDFQQRNLLVAASLILFLSIVTLLLLGPDLDLYIHPVAIITLFTGFCGILAPKFVQLLMIAVILGLVSILASVAWLALSVYEYSEQDDDEDDSNWVGIPFVIQMPLFMVFSLIVMMSGVMLVVSAKLLRQITNRGKLC